MGDDKKDDHDVLKKLEDYKNGFNIIEVKPGRYFIGAWYLHSGIIPAVKDSDWFGTIYRDAGEDVWHIRYRHKYYNSPEPWDKKDRRSNYEGTIDGNLTEWEMMAKMELMTRMMCDVSGYHRDFTYIGTSDPEAVVERLSSKPYMHSRISEFKPKE